MARWKLFGKSKEDEVTDTKETVEEETEEIVKEESEDKPLAEYSETLHAGKPATSKKSSGKHSSKPSDQRIWRDVDSIEEKVDTLHISRAQKPVTELDKTVDKLISKKKKK